VLKHVQVERYFISQRYRTGAVTIGPQMSVDAGERQLTADRSLSALPASLQSIPLFEATGELIDAAGGLLEFSDLLKRPLDTYKYLQLTIETAEVALTQQNVQLNCVMVGSANEVHLDAFREHPEFASFRGRLELVRTPYLRSYVEEQRIYDTHVAPQVRKHVAPHATMTAAMFAVLTRMRKPVTDRYGRSLQTTLGSLSAVEKMDLYATGRVPERLDADAQKVLRANIRAVHDESDSYPIYEGRVGASPREMRVAILDAAQSNKYQCLSPLAVLEEIEALCDRKTEFEWLQQEPLGGGYHDHKQFQEALLGRLLDTWEHELYRASGLVDESQYGELFDRYVQHVSVWVKKERIRNKLTGDYEEPDEKLMREVERMLDLKGDAQETRASMLSAVAAWAIDHPGNKVDPAVVFPHYLKRIRDTIFGEKRTSVAQRARDIVIVVREEGQGLADDRKRDAQATIQRMVDQFGYCPSCAADAATHGRPRGVIAKTTRGGQTRSVAQEVVALALPAIATSLLQTLVFVVDRVMLGHHSPTSLAAMQLAGPVEWSVLSVFLAFEVGTLARVGNLVGKGDRAAARRAAIVSFGLALGLGLLLTAVAPLVRAAIPFAAPRASPDVVHAATDYLEITMAASPIAFVAAVSTATLQASGDTRTPLLIGSFANAIHIGTNRILILGALGIPAMGARGCGISTALTFALEAALGTAALMRVGRAVSLRRDASASRASTRHYRVELSRIVRVGWPAMLERIVYHTGFLGYVGIIATLGDVPMAANQALISIESICFLSADGFGTAAASIVARRLGAGRRDEALAAAWLAAKWAIGLLTTLGVLVLVTRSWLLPIFSDEPRVSEVGQSTVPVLAFAQPFMATGIVLSQALRGSGQTRAALLVSMTGALFVRLTFTWLFAVKLGLGLPGVWMGSTADWVVRSALLLALGVRQTRAVST
jgi:putative MATE family efflux protein